MRAPSYARLSADIPMRANKPLLLLCRTNAGRRSLVLLPSLTENTLVKIALAKAHDEIMIISATYQLSIAACLLCTNRL